MAGRVIGVDAGGTKLLAGVVDERLGVHHRTVRAWRGTDLAAVLDTMVEAVEEARAAAPGARHSRARRQRRQPRRPRGAARRAAEGLLIVHARLGEDAGMVGAGILALARGDC